MRTPRQAVQQSQEVKTEDRPSKVDRVGQARPQRTPIHGYKNILGVKGEEAGYHYCWVNADNVERYEEGGYEFVTHDVKVGDRSIKAASQLGGKVSKHVGTTLSGQPLVAYLMRCTDEIFKEESDRLHRQIDDGESDVVKALNSGREGQYGKVEIGRKGVE